MAFPEAPGHDSPRFLAAVGLIAIVGCLRTVGSPVVETPGPARQVPEATQTTASYAALGGFSDVEVMSVLVVSNGRGPYRLCRVVKEETQHGKTPRVWIARVPPDYHAKLWDEIDELDAFSLEGASYPVIDVSLFEFEVALPGRRHGFAAYGIDSLEDWRYLRFVELLDDCVARFIDIPRHMEALEKGDVKARKRALRELRGMKRSVLVEADIVERILRARRAVGPIDGQVFMLLAKIGPPAARACLELLESEDRSERELALWVLVHVAEEAGEALPHIAKYVEKRIQEAESDAVREGFEKTVRHFRCLEGAVRLWHDGRLRAVTFLPDGKTVACACEDRAVHLWDVEKKERRCRLMVSTSETWAIASTPDGSKIAAGGGDRRVRVWDVASRKELLVLPRQEGSVTALAFWPDGTKIASGSEAGPVRIWDSFTGEEILTIPKREKYVRSLALSPDGKTIATDGPNGSITFWDASTGSKIRALTGHDNPIGCLAFSPDGKMLASGSYDRTVRLWNVSSGAEARSMEGHTGTVRAVAFSHDSRVVASGGNGSTVRLWDASDGKPLAALEGHTGEVTSLDFSPDGLSLVSASEDATAIVWDLTRHLGRLPPGGK